MMSEEAIIKVIGELKSKSDVVTRKKLLEAGLTDYYIKKIDGKYLSKMSKGKYQITYLTDTENIELLEVTKDKTSELIVNSVEVCSDQKFLNSVLREDYEDAYVELKEILGKKTISGIDNSPIYALLLKEILGEEYDFSFLNDLHYKKLDKRSISLQYYLLYRYLISGDYIKTFKKVMSIRYFQFINKGFNDKRVLGIYKLGEKIVKDLGVYEELLKEFKTKIEKKNVQLRSVEENLSKNEEGAVIAPNDGERLTLEVADVGEVVKLQDYEGEAKSSLLEKKDDFVPISDKEIIKLLNSKDYKALNWELLVERSHYVLDTYRYVLCGLTNIYINALKNKIVLSDVSIEKQNVYKSSDAYRYLKKALKTWDIMIIKDALYQLADMIKYEGIDDNWISYYFLIVGEIEEVLIKNREVAEKKKYVDKQFNIIDAKIFNLLNDKEMSDEDFIERIEELYYEKLRIDKEDKNVLLGLDLISLIRTIKAEKLRADDLFKAREMEGATLVEKYNNFIDNCDYMNLKQLLEENDFDNFFFKGAKRRNLFFEKRLLRILGDSFSVWKKNDNTLTSNAEVMPAEAYAKLKSLLKKSDVVGAYVYAKKYESLFSTEMMVLINSWLYVAKEAELSAVQDLYDDYREKLNQGTKHEASVALLNYKERIRGKYLDYNTIYLEKMLNVKDFDLKTVKILNDLMKKANDLVDLQDYTKAVRVLDNYNEIAGKKIDHGYYLQGICYELMGELDKAMTLYEYCVLITQNPSAYLKLGMIYLKREEHEKSLECFLNCQSRIMPGNKEVLDCLLIVNKKLNNTLQVNEYKKELKVYN